MENYSDETENICPLCMEEMDITDRHFEPCPCNYKICLWCWHQIMEMADKDDGRCPACRSPYDKEKIVSANPAPDELVELNTDKRPKAPKPKPRGPEPRRNLGNVRVVQRNLVYVVGLPLNMAAEELLAGKDYFGQYGKVMKIAVSRSTTYSSHSAIPSAGVYVTFLKEEDALRCIHSIDGCLLEGRTMRACFGTTKYCNSYLKGVPCTNPDCLYLHEIGTQEDSFTKEEMIAKYGSKSYGFPEVVSTSQKRHASVNGFPPPADPATVAAAMAHHDSQQPTVVHSTSHSGSSKYSSQSSFKGSVLPPAASWASKSALNPKPAPSALLNKPRASAQPPILTPSMAIPISHSQLNNNQQNQYRPSPAVLGGRVIHASSHPPPLVAFPSLSSSPSVLGSSPPVVAPNLEPTPRQAAMLLSQQQQLGRMKAKAINADAASALSGGGAPKNSAPVVHQQMPEPEEPDSSPEGDGDPSPHSMNGQTDAIDLSDTENSSEPETVTASQSASDLPPPGFAPAKSVSELEVVRNGIQTTVADISPEDGKTKVLDNSRPSSAADGEANPAPDANDDNVPEKGQNYSEPLPDPSTEADPLDLSEPVTDPPVEAIADVETGATEEQSSHPGITLQQDPESVALDDEWTEPETIPPAGFETLGTKDLEIIPESEKLLMASLSAPGFSAFTRMSRFFFLFEARKSIVAYDLGDPRSSKFAFPSLGSTPVPRLLSGLKPTVSPWHYSTYLQNSEPEFLAAVGAASSLSAPPGFSAPSAAPSATARVNSVSAGLRAPPGFTRPLVSTLAPTQTPAPTVSQPPALSWSQALQQEECAMADGKTALSLDPSQYLPSGYVLDLFSNRTNGPLGTEHCPSFTDYSVDMSLRVGNGVSNKSHPVAGGLSGNATQQSSQHSGLSVPAAGTSLTFSGNIQSEFSIRQAEVGGGAQHPPSISTSEAVTDDDSTLGLSPGSSVPTESFDRLSDTEASRQPEEIDAETSKKASGKVASGQQRRKGGKGGKGKLPGKAEVNMSFTVTGDKQRADVGQKTKQRVSAVRGPGGSVPSASRALNLALLTEGTTMGDRAPGMRLTWQEVLQLRLDDELESNPDSVAFTDPLTALQNVPHIPPGAIRAAAKVFQLAADMMADASFSDDPFKSFEELAIEAFEKEVPELAAILRSGEPFAEAVGLWERRLIDEHLKEDQEMGGMAGSDPPDAGPSPTHPPLDPAAASMYRGQEIINLSAQVAALEREVAIAREEEKELAEELKAVLKKVEKSNQLLAGISARRAIANGGKKRK